MDHVGTVHGTTSIMGTESSDGRTTKDRIGVHQTVVSDVTRGIMVTDIRMEGIIDRIHMDICTKPHQVLGIVTRRDL